MKPVETIANDIQSLRDDKKMSLDMFYRDPYMLDFLGLKDTFSEKDLENAILLEFDKGNIHVGQYLTKMPPKELLQEKLSLAISNAKEQNNDVSDNTLTIKFSYNSRNIKYLGELITYNIL